MIMIIRKMAIFIPSTIIMTLPIDWNIITYVEKCKQFIWPVHVRLRARDHQCQVKFTLCGENIIVRVLNAIVSCHVDDIFVGQF